MSGNISKKIAFNYFGGKFQFLEQLYACFPSDFNHLCDLFCGSMAVSLNYGYPVIKTANDVNDDIVNFFSVLRDHEQELLRLLQLTPVAKSEYDNCWIKSENNIENARRFYVRIRQSFFGLGAQRRNKGWHMAKGQSNANGGETVSKWNNAIDKLPEVATALRQQFQITNFSWEECIDKIDNPKCFFYCDPPYPKNTRASYNDYKFEFTDSDHEALAEKLHRIQGMAMVSSYNSDMYNSLYADWEKIEFPVKKNNIRSGEVREIVWINYEIKNNTLF